MSKVYYWLKLDKDFFKGKEIKKLRKVAGGDTYTIIYLKLQLLSLKDEGKLYFDGIEDTFAEELALELDEDSDNITFVLMFLKKCGLIQEISDDEILINTVPSLIGKETDKAELMRRKRRKDLNKNEDTKKIEPKTNVERQRSFKAKKYCEEKQHIPFIEDYMNLKRYNGNYYTVLKRDIAKCRICGSIENICVHHIDGYDEQKKENSNENKMLTLCRSCHIQIHRSGLNIPTDILESIDYFGNESNSVTKLLPRVTNCYTEKRREDKELDNNSASKDDINIIIEEIWKAYPNKKGKADYIKKIPKILKTISKEKLIQAIDRYKADVENQRNNGFKTLNYANGSTFFNGRYMDYLEDINQPTENKAESQNSIYTEDFNY